MTAMFFSTKGTVTPPTEKFKSKLVLSLFSSFLVIHTLLFYVVVGTEMELYGDEKVYYSKAGFLERIIYDVSHGSNLTDSIKERAGKLYGVHFMPGLAFILALPKICTDDVKLLRFALLFLNISLLILSGFLIFKHSSTLRASLFYILMGVVPLNALGTMIMWNDFLCGILLLVAYLVQSDTLSRPDTGSKYRWRMLCVGMLLGLACNFRYSTIAISFFLGVLLFFDLVIRQKRIKVFFFSGMFLLTGFFLLYGPWIIISSIEHNQFMYAPEAKNKYGIRTWAMSPPGEELLGYRKTPKYYAKVDEVKKLHDIGRHDAQKIILEEVEEKATISSRLRAYRTNTANFFLNPNQFLGIMMYKVDVLAKRDWKVDLKAKPLIGLYTYGGQMYQNVKNDLSEKDRYLQPVSNLKRMYLVFNDTVYGVLIAFLLASFCVSLVSGKIVTPGMYIWPFILGSFLVVFFHPAHGRYIFSLMPILVYCASCFCESLGTLWKEGNMKEIKSVSILTSLFFVAFMV